MYKIAIDRGCRQTIKITVNAINKTLIKMPDVKLYKTFNNFPSLQ